MCLPEGSRGIALSIFDSGNRIESEFLLAFLKSLSSDLGRVGRVLSEHGIDYAVIGGCAAVFFGYFHGTDDVDILVKASDRSAVESLLAGFEFETRTALPPDSKPMGAHLHFSGLPEGWQGAFPDPSQIALEWSGIKFVTLDKLIVMKLESGRGAHGIVYRHLADVQKLVCANSLPREYVEAFGENLRQRYCEIWDQMRSVDDVPK
jgi:hypothetical protein